LLSQPSHKNAEKRDFSTRNKGEKQLSRSTLVCKLQRTLKNMGRSPYKRPTFSEKTRRKKDKRRSFSLENSDVYLASFGEGCESKKYKIAVMRAREGRTDEKRKLYTVIATNNEPCARQLHYAKQSTDLRTTAPRARVGRLTVGCYMTVQVLFLVPLPKNSKYQHFDKFTYQNRVQYYFSCHFFGDFSLFA